MKKHGIRLLARRKILALVNVKQRYFLQYAIAILSDFLDLAKLYVPSSNNAKSRLTAGNLEISEKGYFRLLDLLRNWVHDNSA